ncbi:MAG TPA: B12-binding domain-containing protein [Chitinispirillaceae bacterium]|nr:B12-binding domain-containing protein [Chitinispirillaceae bacterium]
MATDISVTERFQKALLAVDRIMAREVIEEASQRSGLISSIEEVIVPVLEEIGKKWEKGEIALSQYYMSGRICEEIISRLFPLNHSNISFQPKIAIVTLEDYHLLGKQIVYSFLLSIGYKIRDYGTMVVPDLIKRSLEDDIRLLLISVLMLPSALRVKDVKQGFIKAGKEIKIAVGGAPFRLDPQLWKKVGADMGGRNASDAMDIVIQFLAESG